MFRYFVSLLALFSTMAFAEPGPSHFKCWSSRGLPYVELAFQEDVNKIIGNLNLKVARLMSVDFITYRKVELEQIDETGWLGSFSDGAFTIRWLENEMFKGHLSYMDGFSVLEFNLNCQNIN